MKLKNIPFRLESRLVRRWYRTTGGRPSSAPFLSGDGFRALTPWRYEPATAASFDPAGVPEGAVVFCEAWLLEAFLKTVAPRFAGPVTVLSANGDPNFTPEKLAWLPATVKRLWTQNLDADHPRVEPLPIGLENARLHLNGIAADFRSLRRAAPPALNRILWGFSEVTNPSVRGLARRALEACPLADKQPAVNARAYRKNARRYRFLASPPGNGLDCHRTWEALYLGVVPIVLRSVLTLRLEALGLPVWLVDSYDELASVTEAGLEARYQRLAGGFKNPALWMDFWKGRIFGSP